MYICELARIWDSIKIDEDEFVDWTPNIFCSYAFKDQTSKIVELNEIYDRFKIIMEMAVEVGNFSIEKAFETKEEVKEME
jgi:hypothetical protein